MRSAWLVLAVAAMALVLSTTPASAQEQPDDGQELVERFAPIIAVRAQTAPCDTIGEQFLPTSADIVLDNPHVVVRQIGVGNPVLKTGPTSSDIFDMGEAFFLDFPGDAFKPDCIYERDYNKYNEGRDPVIYAHIATQADQPDKLAVQYWFFYYYNKYNNLHEGDWEGIQLLFDVGSIEEALDTTPSSVGLSQHFGGEVASWDEEKLERLDTHPVVYPAVGSHASYFAPALYLGRSGSQGFGCDTTIDAERRLEPDVVLLPDSVDSPDDPLAWLMFEGLWGEQRFGPFSGATGPITKPRWTHPVDWHDTLRTSSVVVPDGTETTTPYVNGFCSVVGFGSTQYLVALQNPLPTALVLGAIGLAVWFLVGRTQWNAVHPFPIVARRRLGQILTSSVRLYWQHRSALVQVGLLYIPLALGSTLLTGLIGLATGPLGIVGTGLTGLTNIVLQVLSLVMVSAAVIRMISTFDDDDPTNNLSAIDGYRYSFSKLSILATVAARGIAIVLGLAVTIVGLPWAIRQYVRYQVATASIVLEDTTAVAAMQRSSALIRGRRRWWHTALALLSLQGVIGLLGAISGLGFLILANGLPLGIYSAITSIGGALVLPYIGATSALIYGNVVAETSEPQPAHSEVAYSSVE